MAKVKLSAFDRLRLGARLNRKERRDVEQRLSAADLGLEIVNRDAAGIDVGNESHYVAVPRGRDKTVSISHCEAFLCRSTRIRQSNRIC